MDTSFASDATSVSNAVTKACRWLLTGRVQGVGFRPFAYQLAHECGIRGYVQNRSGQVVIYGEGPPQALMQFGIALLSKAPPLARPRIAVCNEQTPIGCIDFAILASEADSDPEIHLPPDYFCCDDCLRELNDPADRRYRYPFINCTQCGPRYTLISALPYDRANTSMAGFAMCAACRLEYENPADRRFHAEPIACPACGPQLSFHMPGSPILEDADSALATCIGNLKAGRIAAVKGVGGYHLMVDAMNDAAVSRLRERKHRPHKPLALMFPIDADLLRQVLELDPVEHAALFDPARPIVLVRSRPDSGLAPSIHPGLNQVGVMLPYSPLHHLLMHTFGRPLVATSANLSSEPVLTEAAEVEARLGNVADCYLHHNRRIVRPADDSVVRVIAGKPRAIRMGRGVAPIELSLPFPLRQPVLAAGSHMKNTIALGWDNRAVVSPHIGDLESPRAIAVFDQVCADVQALYDVAPQLIACDAHPGFASTRRAQAFGLPLVKVLHHHAHASALAAEHPEIDQWLTFTWDGVGLGEDNTLWGGEGFVGRPGKWRRVTTLRSFHLPGAGQAAHAPWRSAAALCWETGRAWHDEQYALLLQARQRRLNCRQTSAVGRLFDGAAALVGLLDEASYEGQGPMWLEAAAGDEAADAISLPLERNTAGLWELDWEPLLPFLTDDRHSVPKRAAAFHTSLAHGLLAQARAVRDEVGIRHIGLCGGVFQNRRLSEHAGLLLKADGFDVHLPERLPCNDAALAFGQLVEAGARQ